MPLSELVRYFNLADDRGDSTLYTEGERIAAWHQGLRLGSSFEPVVDLRRERIVGHQARLVAWQDDGRPITSEAAYAHSPSAESVVGFDRLVRTLHALNFLGQQRYAGGFLILPVHARHLQAVQSQHGLVFEAILKRCGLSPEDIVLELDHRDVSGCSHLVAALHNYRQRGYRLALSGVEGPLAAMQALQLRPDMVKLDADAAQETISLLGQGAVRLLQDGIASRDDLAVAGAAAIDLGKGSLFGLPDPECRATHLSGRVAYNSLSSIGVVT